MIFPFQCFQIFTEAEPDTKVFDRMRDALQAAEAANQQQVQWKFLGLSVCLRSWMRLHGIGCLICKFNATFCLWKPSLHVSVGMLLGSQLG